MNQQVTINIVAVAMTGQCRERVVGFGFLLPDSGVYGFHVYLTDPEF